MFYICDMIDTKQKYIRLERFDEIIIFPQLLEHSEFRNLNPISAGFCYVHSDKIMCFGESISLGITSMEDDSLKATKQVFGWDAMEKLQNEK